jgi:hypothetical protein
MLKSPRGLDRHQIARRFRVSLSLVDRQLADVPPIRKGIRGKRRSLWALSAVAAALAGNPSKLSEPTRRLLAAQRRLVQAEIARIEASHLSSSDVEATWCRFVEHVRGILKPWLASVAASLVEPLADAQGEHFVADLVRPVLERLAVAPENVSAPSRRRTAAGGADVTTTDQLRAAFVDDRATLAELRERVRVGDYRPARDVEREWASRVQRSRDALWTVLLGRVASLHERLDIPKLRALLEEATNDALNHLTKGTTTADADDDLGAAAPADRRARAGGAVFRPRRAAAAARRAAPAGASVPGRNGHVGADGPFHEETGGQQ